MTTTYTQRAARAVVMGESLPAHDDVFDLATRVAADLDELHAYVTSVRTPEQADAAVTELLAHLIEHAKHP